MSALLPLLPGQTLGVMGGGQLGRMFVQSAQRMGYRTVVLEAETVGYGASGRNGGQVCTGFSSSQAKIEAQLGKADAAKAEKAGTKEVCHDVMGKDNKPVKNKDGSVKQQCKTIKIHKKHEGTEIPPKK